MGIFSAWHWLVIGGVALLLFGNRLPEVARSIGKAVNEFKRGLREVSDGFDDEIDQDSEKRKLKSPPDDDDDHATPSESRAREPAKAGKGPESDDE